MLLHSSLRLLSFAFAFLSLSLSLFFFLSLSLSLSQHHAHQLKTKDLEAKLAEAKLAQQSDFAAAEAKKAREQQAKIDTLKSLEVNLRAQLSGYADKFEAVQTTLTKSNELFTNFKTEMVGPFLLQPPFPRWRALSHCNGAAAAC